MQRGYKSVYKSRLSHFQSDILSPFADGCGHPSISPCVPFPFDAWSRAHCIWQQSCFILGWERRKKRVPFLRLSWSNMIINLSFLTSHPFFAALSPQSLLIFAVSLLWPFGLCMSVCTSSLFICCWRLCWRSELVVYFFLSECDFFSNKEKFMQFLFIYEVLLILGIKD